MAKLAERRREVLSTMMKDAIYDGAVQVLTEHGLDGFTMDRVALAVGVATGSLYNYFDNKVELLRFVHERTFTPLRERVSEVVESDMPAAGKLESIVRTVFAHFGEHRGLLKFFFTEFVAGVSLEHEKETGRTFAIRNLTQVVKEGRKEGAFLSHDPEQVAAIVFGAVHTLTLQRLGSDESWPVEELVDTVMDVFLHGLAAKETT